MKLRAASRSSSFLNATSRSAADPNMCWSDHRAKRLPRSNSGSASVDFAPSLRSQGLTDKDARSGLVMRRPQSFLFWQITVEENRHGILSV